MWAGKTVVCIASGPSLTLEDCALVERSGLPTIAVNSSWKRARFCDVIYAGDPGWWKNYGFEIDIDAQRWTCLENAAKTYDINWHRGFHNVSCSGIRAIQFAIYQGAAKVILLGYDTSLKKGSHFHGDHKKTKNPGEKDVLRWKRDFALIDTNKVVIVNCSRYTELECFKTGLLEDNLK